MKGRTLLLICVDAYVAYRLNIINQNVFVKKVLLFCICCLLGLKSVSAENVIVSVITCSPGDEAYSLFGHTGLRYRNVDEGVDVVFGYGYFDFNAPNFIWRFVLGETDYMVGVVSYDHFIGEYEERGSAVVEQVLDLTPEQENSIYMALVDNCRPQNRVYRYNYFYNNCTTRIRDQVLAVAGSLSYDGNTAREMTFRDALASLTSAHPWYAFGINLLLGSDVDRMASRHELQFIPSFFMSDLDASSVGNNGVRLVRETRELVHEQPRKSAMNHFTPFNASLLLLLLTLIVMLCELRCKKTFWWYDMLFMLIQGIPGLLLLFMALFSSHPAVGGNWLILLLNPLALIVVPVMVWRARKGRGVALAWLQVVFVVLFFLSAIFSMQVYPVPVYFCAVALLARSLFHIYKDKICDLNLL